MYKEYDLIVNTNINLYETRKVLIVVSRKTEHKTYSTIL